MPTSSNSSKYTMRRKQPKRRNLAAKNNKHRGGFHSSKKYSRKTKHKWETENNS